MEWKWISAISLMHQLEQTYSVHFLLIFPSSKKRMNIEHTAIQHTPDFFLQKFFFLLFLLLLLVQLLSLGWNDFSNKKDYFAVVVFDVIELELWNWMEITIWYLILLHIFHSQWFGELNKSSSCFNFYHELILKSVLLELRWCVQFLFDLRL